jgi:hypothetical protein
MHPKGLYEPELVKRWRERLRRFELSELVRGTKARKKPTPDKASTVKAEERAKTLVDA